MLLEFVRLYLLENKSVPVQEEIDDYDCFVPIFIAYEDEKALGTARVIIKNKDIAKIGRVAVSQKRHVKKVLEKI